MTSPEDPFAPPPGPPPPYGTPVGQPAPYGTPVAVVRNGLGTAALVLGILAVVLSVTIVGGVILGLLAIVLGAVGRGRARRGEATNGGIALAGIITGATGLLLSVALVALGIGLLTTGTGKELKNCLEQANGDQAAMQVCQNRFRDKLVNRSLPAG